MTLKPNEYIINNTILNQTARNNFLANFKKGENYDRSN